MISSLFVGLSRTASIFLLALRSNYVLIDKIEIFRILIAIWLKRKFVKNGSIIHQRIFNFTVSGYDYHTLHFLFKEVFLFGDYYFEAANDAPRIIDCGSNIGMSVLFFKKLYPKCSIVAFEPNPHAFSLLTKNVEQNNLEDVQLNNIGLSDEKGEIKFYLNENKGSLMGSLIEARGGVNHMSVRTDKLSSHVADQTFDLAKIDIEGAEHKVIEDLATSDTLRQIDRYIIEYHHGIENSNSGLSKFVRFFEDGNFDFKMKSNISKTRSFQDILFYGVKKEN